VGDLCQCSPSGGRTWWAHVEFTRIDIELTILKKEIEDSGEVALASRIVSDHIPNIFVKVLRLRTSGRTLAIFGVKKQHRHGRIDALTHFNPFADRPDIVAGGGKLAPIGSYVVIASFAPTRRAPHRRPGRTRRTFQL